MTWWTSKSSSISNRVRASLTKKQDDIEAMTAAPVLPAAQTAAMAKSILAQYMKAGSPPFATGGHIGPPVSPSFTTPASPYVSALAPSGSPVITSSGMEGFSERGGPDDWDMAVGEIYGYRWWRMNVPASFAGFIDAPKREPHISALTGANNHGWGAGRQEAVCSVYGLYPYGYNPEYAVDPVLARPHEPPEIKVSCGCGFWAYFDKNLDLNEHFPKMADHKPGLLMNSHVGIPVFGVIKGTGRVITGTKGFRTQYAEIVGLCLPQVAQNRLGWWHAGTQQDGEDSYGNHYGRNPRGIPAHVLKAFQGKPGLYTDTAPVEEGRHKWLAASDYERLARVALVETMLSDYYPDVRIFSTQEALTGYFPPDKNYAP